MWHKLQACNRAVTYISDCCRVLKQSLDGKNLEIVLLELGVRLHQVVYEHVQQYTVNEIGNKYTVCESCDCGIYMWHYETHKYFEAPLFFKPHGALGQLFEVAGPPSAALHWRGYTGRNNCKVCTLSTTTLRVRVHTINNLTF